MSSNLERAADCWNKYSEKTAHRSIGVSWWEAGPEIGARINRAISGDPDCDYTTYTLRKYFPGKTPLGCCLSLGCGLGSLERSLARQQAFHACDAFDAAEGSLALARLAAREAGFENIHYAAADINTIRLEEGKYDAVWIQGALHHFEALEHVCGQIARALKPGGLLILNEYVGPDRFQFPQRQKEIIDSCLQLLPRRYRARTQEALLIEAERSPLRQGPRWFLKRLGDKIRDGDLLPLLRRRLAGYWQRRGGKAVEKNKVAFPSASDVIAHDPTEAVRSSEILPVTRRYFEILEKKELGGNILQFLLDDIAGNFSAEDPASQAYLRLIIAIEDTLLQSGELESDFAYIVARPLPPAAKTG